MIDAGVHGLIMLGHGRRELLARDGEKLEVLRATVEHVAGRVPVLSGVAECTTRAGLPLRRATPSGPASTG